MTDGPFRDLGSGFVRLSGLEAPRRAPSTLSSVEDVLGELLLNAHEAGAGNIYVATSLRHRRFRTLIVLDDGAGVPEALSEEIFAAGVTSKPDSRAAGLALHHIRSSALEARLCNPKSPTSLKVVLDTHTLPERALQSTSRRSDGPSRTSKTNLLATALDFARTHPSANLYLGTPSETVARLINHRIIQKSEEARSGAGWRVGGDRGSEGRSLGEVVERLGFDLSGRTLARVISGRIPAASRVEAGGTGKRLIGRSGRREVEGARLALGEKERAGIASILRGAAAASYLALGEVRFESREGRVEIRAEVLYPEEEYDD